MGQSSSQAVANRMMDDDDAGGTPEGSSPDFSDADSGDELVDEKYFEFPEFCPRNTIDGCLVNGLTLSGHVLPEEVLCIILSKVDVTDLLTCRRVCQTWKYIVDSGIWRHLFPLSLYRRLLSLESMLQFSVYYMLLKKKPFNRNLIKNPCGAEGYHFWHVQKEGWSDGWAIENPPCGADPVPVDDDCNGTHCFATSYQLCSKMQRICLAHVGVAPVIMDKLKPTISVSDWYAGRFDCACDYKLRVTLMDKMNGVLDEYETTSHIDQWQGRAWNKVSHEFKDYPEGVRFIVFSHCGKDSQFWKGHYGSKMTKSCVKLIF